MFEPVKVAFGEFMGRFYASLVPTTKPMREYCERGLVKSVAIAPGRLVDAAENILNSWIKNVQESEYGGTAGPSKNHQLPAIVVGFALDSPAYDRDFGRQMPDPEWIMIPTDPLNRIFKVRAIGHDMRVQVLIFSHDEPTARSIAAQFQLWVERPDNRRFKAKYEFAQTTTEWPVQLESDTAPFMNVPSEAKNLVILGTDLTLKATVPLFESSPVGKGLKPYGFPDVRQIRYDGYVHRDHETHAYVGDKLVP